MTHILSLPDELLLQICEYLTSAERIFLSQTCMRLGDVINTSCLLRVFNVSASYDLEISDLKDFLRVKPRCSLITVMNISSCYWLSASDIISCVTKLKQLRSLYAGDTQLTFSHLKKVLPPLKKLQRLSISADVKSLQAQAGCITSLSQELGSLKYLFVYITIDEYGVALTSLTQWLEYCNGLEELWLVSRLTGKPLQGVEVWPAFSNKISFPHLHTCVLESLSERGHMLWLEFVTTLLKPCPGRPWKRACMYQQKNLPLPEPLNVQGSEVLFTHSLEYGEYLQLKHLIAVRYDCESFFKETVEIPRLENLCIANTHNCFDKFIWLEKFDRLHTLAFLSDKFSNVHLLFTSIAELGNLSCLAFVECKFIMPLEERPDVIKSFKILTQKLPNLKELRFSANIEPYKEPWLFWDKMLLCISNWTQLVKLSLENVLFLEDKFIVKIAESCCNIESVNFAHLGRKSLCTHIPAVTKALGKWSKLKDFRFEQHNIVLLRQLIVSLQSCQTLERIAIIDESMSNVLPAREFKNSELMWLFIKAKHLVFFYFRANLLLVWRNKVQAEVKEIQQQGKVHPRLIIFLENDRNGLIPWIHRSMVNYDKEVPWDGSSRTWYYPQPGMC